MAIGKVNSEHKPAAYSLGLCTANAGRLQLAGERSLIGPRVATAEAGALAWASKVCPVRGKLLSCILRPRSGQRPLGSHMLSWCSYLRRQHKRRTQRDGLGQDRLPFLPLRTNPPSYRRQRRPILEKWNTKLGEANMYGAAIKHLHRDKTVATEVRTWERIDIAHVMMWYSYMIRFVYII